MSGLEGLLAIVIVALMPVALVFITRYYALREKELMVRAEGDVRRIDQIVDEKRRLEGRIEALESIVCTVDFELNQRIHRLALPAPSAASLGAPTTSATTTASVITTSPTRRSGSR